MSSVRSPQRQNVSPPSSPIRSTPPRSFSPPPSARLPPAFSVTPKSRLRLQLPGIDTKNRDGRGSPRHEYAQAQAPPMSAGVVGGGFGFGAIKASGGRNRSVSVSTGGWKEGDRRKEEHLTNTISHKNYPFQVHHPTSSSTTDLRTFLDTHNQPQLSSSFPSHPSILLSASERRPSTSSIHSSRSKTLTYSTDEAPSEDDMSFGQRSLRSESASNRSYQGSVQNTLYEEGNESFGSQTDVEHKCSLKRAPLGKEGRHHSGNLSKVLKWTKSLLKLKNPPGNGNCQRRKSRKGASVDLSRRAEECGSIEADTSMASSSTLVDDRASIYSGESSFVNTDSPPGTLSRGRTVGERPKNNAPLRRSLSAPRQTQYARSLKKLGESETQNSLSARPQDENPKTLSQVQPPSDAPGHPPVPRHRRPSLPFDNLRQYTPSASSPLVAGSSSHRPPILRSGTAPPTTPLNTLSQYPPASYGRRRPSHPEIGRLGHNIRSSPNREVIGIESLMQADGSGSYHGSNNSDRADINLSSFAAAPPQSTAAVKRHNYNTPPTYDSDHQEPQPGSYPSPAPSPQPSLTSTTPSQTSSQPRRPSDPTSPPRHQPSPRRANRRMSWTAGPDGVITKVWKEDHPVHITNTSSGPFQSAHRTGRERAGSDVGYRQVDGDDGRRFHGFDGRGGVMETIRGLVNDD